MVELAQQQYSDESLAVWLKKFFRNEQHQLGIEPKQLNSLSSILLSGIL